MNVKRVDVGEVVSCEEDADGKTLHLVVTLDATGVPTGWNGADLKENTGKSMTYLSAQLVLANGRPLAVTSRESNTAEQMDKIRAAFKKRTKKTGPTGADSFLSRLDDADKLKTAVGKE